MKIDNIYALIAILFTVVAFLGTVLFIFIRKGSIKISKDGLVVNTSDGKYLSIDRTFNINAEIVKLERVIWGIKFNDIIHEQMKYLERESVSFYSDLVSSMPENKNLYKRVFELHRLRMLDIFRDELIKKNHFLEKTDWKEYIRLMGKYTYNMSREIFFEISEDFERDGIVLLKVLDDDAVLKIYMDRFSEWMEEFRNITRDKVAEINKIQNNIDKLLAVIGYQSIDVMLGVKDE